MTYIVRNKRAYFDYEILDQLEAGIALNGAEVKTLRLGRASLSGAFIVFRNEQAYLKSWQIPRWKFAAITLDERRDRRLLLHKNQIVRWQKKMDATSGLTIVPLKVYFSKRGHIKLQIGLCKGKKQYDKRATIKKRESDRKLTAKLKG